MFSLIFPSFIDSFPRAISVSVSPEVWINQIWEFSWQKEKS